MYAKELAAACALARAAGAACLRFYEATPEFELKLSVDGRLEPVTRADWASNEVIVPGLHGQFPEDAVLSEESADDPRRLSVARAWMVDPLDGTKGFVARTGDFAVQIGLVVEGRVVLGVVYRPLQNVLYRAVEGGGAWVERGGTVTRRLTVSCEGEPDRMRLAISRAHGNPTLEAIVEHLGMTRTECDSVGVKVGLLVEQACDVYVHPSPHTKLWDTCAPEIVLREAGGRFTDCFGEHLAYDRANVQNHTGILASNGVTHARLLEEIRPYIKDALTAFHPHDQRLAAVSAMSS